MEQLASLLCWKALYLFMIVLATLPHRKSRSRSSYQYFPVEYSYRRNGHCDVFEKRKPTIFNFWFRSLFYNLYWRGSSTLLLGRTDLWPSSICAVYTGLVQHWSRWLAPSIQLIGACRAIKPTRPARLTNLSPFPSFPAFLASPGLYLSNSNFVSGLFPFSHFVV